MTDYVVPALLLGASLLALRRKENAYDLMLEGGAEGLKLVLTILPALVVLLTAVQMLKDMTRKEQNKMRLIEKQQQPQGKRNLTI